MLRTSSVTIIYVCDVTAPRDILPHTCRTNSTVLTFSCFIYSFLGPSSCFIRSWRNNSFLQLSYKISNVDCTCTRLCLLFVIYLAVEPYKFIVWCILLQAVYVCCWLVLLSFVRLLLCFISYPLLFPDKSFFAETQWRKLSF